MQRPDFIEVPTLPPGDGKRYRWDFDSDIWLEDQSNAAIATAADANTKAIVEVLDKNNPTLQEMRSHKILLLNDLDLLNVGNDVDDWENLDLLYYRSVQPRQKNTGIYTSSKGYLAFPGLSWQNDSSNPRTTSFIWFCSNDSRYPSFGLASRERYRWSSNDYGLAEILLRFKTYRGCYHQYGLTSQGNKTYSNLGYEGFDANQFYRLNLLDNGKSASLYQLKDAEPQNWLGGQLIHDMPVCQTPSRSGQTLVPYVGDYLGSKNYLLGVMVK